MEAQPVVNTVTSAAAVWLRTLEFLVQALYAKLVLIGVLLQLAARALMRMLAFPSRYGRSWSSITFIDDGSNKTTGGRGLERITAPTSSTATLVTLRVTSMSRELLRDDAMFDDASQF